MPHSLSIDIQRIKPYWLSAAAAVVPFVVDEGPGIDIVAPATVGLGGDTILLYNNDGTPVEEFAATAAGLADGLLAVDSGQWLRINTACSITLDFTLPAGVELRGDSKLQITIIGQVTLGDGAKLSHLTIANAANDANDLYGVQGPTSGTAYIDMCDISATQAGAGNAYAVGAVNALYTGNGNIEVRRCKLNGTSVGGSGYAGRSTRGKLYVWHSIAYGSTARWVQT